MSTLKYNDLDHSDTYVNKEIYETDGVKRITVTVLIYEKTTVTWFSVWDMNEESGYEVKSVHDTLKEAIEAYNKI
jgi:hypothetical protein